MKAGLNDTITKMSNPFNLPPFFEKPNKRGFIIKAKYKPDGMKMGVGIRKANALTCGIDSDVNIINTSSGERWIIW
jgi:hypothetical protein